MSESYTKELDALTVPKRPQVNMRLSKQDYLDFRWEAEKLGMSLAEFIRNCVYSHFQDDDDNVEYAEKS